MTDEAVAREFVGTGLALALPGAAAATTPGATVAAAVDRARQGPNAESAALTPAAFVATEQQVAQQHGLSCIMLQG